METNGRLVWEPSGERAEAAESTLRCFLVELAHGRRDLRLRVSRRAPRRPFEGLSRRHGAAYPLQPDPVQEKLANAASFGTRSQRLELALGCELDDLGRSSERRDECGQSAR